VLKRHHHCENNELSELSVLRYKEQEVCAFVETLMPLHRQRRNRRATVRAGVLDRQVCPHARKRQVSET
jgi:hypothetical protein